MILKKSVYYEGENEKKKVTIVKDNEKHFTCFVKTKGNGNISVLESNGQDLRSTVNMITDIFKIPISLED